MRRNILLKWVPEISGNRASKKKLIKTQGFCNVLITFFLEAPVQKKLAVRLLRDSFPIYIILGPGGGSEPLARHMNVMTKLTI